MSPPAPAKAAAIAYVPSTPWRPLEAALAATAAFLVSITIGMAAVVVTMSNEPNAAIGLVVGTLVQQTVMILAIWWLAGLKGGERTAVLALGPPRQGWWSYVEAAILVLVAAASMSSIIQAIDPGLVRKDLNRFGEIISSSYWWAMFPMVGIGAPLWEEFAFRGFLLSALGQSPLGVIGGAILLSAIWAGVHAYSMAGMLQVFVIGLVFSAILIRSGSLRVPIVIHAAYNILVTAFLVSDAGRSFIAQ